MHIRRHRNFIKEGQKFWGGFALTENTDTIFSRKPYAEIEKKLEY